MSDQKNSRAKSPFAELSFSEQQEQWRQFRSQPLDFHTTSAEPPAPQKPAPAKAAACPCQKAAAAPSQPAAFHPAPPSHKNLDRVRAQLHTATSRTGAYQPTVRE